LDYVVVELVKNAEILSAKIKIKKVIKKVIKKPRKITNLKDKNLLLIFEFKY